MEIRVKRTNAQNPASDELYHWKYIKREWVNGKWKYYYEDDNAKLNLGKVERSKGEFDINGTKVTTYAVKSKETGDKWESVDEKTYKKNKPGYKLYIGNTPLSKVAKDQLTTYRHLIEDVLRGRT